MKKLLVITMLLSSVNIMHGATYAEMIQQALTGQAPAPVASTAPAASASSVNFEELKNAIAPLISNIRILLPKIAEAAAKNAQGGITGFFGGIAAMGMDAEARTALTNLYSQINTIRSAFSKLAVVDPAQKEVAKGYLNQVVANPDYQKLLELSKNVPLIGGQLHDYLASLLNPAQ